MLFSTNMASRISDKIKEIAIPEKTDAFLVLTNPMHIMDLKQVKELEFKGVQYMIGTTVISGYLIAVVCKEGLQTTKIYPINTPAIL